MQDINDSQIAVLHHVMIQQTASITTLHIYSGLLSQDLFITQNNHTITNDASLKTLEIRPITVVFMASTFFS